MKKTVATVCLALAVVGCQPDSTTVPEHIHRRTERRAAELTVELDQANAVQRDLERTLVVTACAVAALAVALIRRRKGG